ncbi:helix-turn-helix domain-containing protein [Adlercreutzia equolifaciens]
MLKDTIKKLRTEQGLSQDELAERIHVVRQTVSKWERGTSVPDADSLVALARALGVSAAELLGESAMAEKEPNELAWETSLLDERITSESQRLDRLVRSLKWALVGAAVMAGEPVQPMAVVGS